AATFHRGLQRMEGTVLGGVVAALLAALIRSPLELAAVLFPLVTMTLATLPLHYGAYGFFLTPVFVLLSITHFGDWQLAGIRIVDTLIGSSLGLLGSVVLWPNWERRRFTSVMAECLQVNCRYLLVIERLQTHPGAVTPADWVAARREAGLANNRADESLSRLLSEPGWSKVRREAAMAFVTYMRRVAQYGTALATGAGSNKETVAQARELGEVARGLLSLVEQIKSGSVIAETPAPSDELSRVETQSVILHRLAARIVSGH
ncbi:MAG: FUSC family protein, partial [Acidobacteriaceae bacterium]|nr:FUSC family protein [Acidobacteriaceae bacterium]